MQGNEFGAKPRLAIYERTGPLATTLAGLGVGAAAGGQECYPSGWLLEVRC